MMGKYILAHWCYSGNFGDALNPYLLEKLSGMKVKYCNSFKPDYKVELWQMIKTLLHLHRYNFRLLLPPEDTRPVVLAIGSILSRSRQNYLVWGGGYMDASEKGLGGKYLAVRGPYSAEKLEAGGYPRCNVYGDPALLLPLVYTPKSTTRYRIGIIPHLRDYPEVKKEIPEFKVFHLGGKIETIIDEICGCEFILSTSLHGVIVAHAYGVPALWVKWGYIFTDGIKFSDYFASVDIPIYDGAQFNLNELVHLSYREIPENIRTLMLPHKPLIEVQRGLLQVAPFKVKQNILDRVKYT